MAIFFFVSRQFVVKYFLDFLLFLLITNESIGKA